MGTETKPKHTLEGMGKIYPPELGVKEGRDLWNQAAFFKHKPKMSPINHDGFNHYEGTRILPDGRIIETYLSQGWMYRRWIWKDEAAWDAFHGSWETYDPEKVVGPWGPTEAKAEGK